MLLRLVGGLTALGDKKELAEAEGMSDLAVYNYFEPPTARERVVLIGSAKTDASVCKTLARICFVARPFPARAAWLEAALTNS